MNARRRLQREIIRRRTCHPHPWPPPLFTRITAPNGMPVRVEIRACTCALGHRAHADYRTGLIGRVYAAWPPTPDTLRELGRWA